MCDPKTCHLASSASPLVRTFPPLHIWRLLLLSSVQSPLKPRSKVGCLPSSAVFIIDLGQNTSTACAQRSSPNLPKTFPPSSTLTQTCIGRRHFKKQRQNASGSKMNLVDCSTNETRFDRASSLHPPKSGLQQPNASERLQYSLRLRRTRRMTTLISRILMSISRGTFYVPHPQVRLTHFVASSS
jgi:hypothetical protein